MRTVVLLIAAACTATDSQNPPDTGSTTGTSGETGTEPEPKPTLTPLAVATLTTGNVVDADGYQFQIDGGSPQPIDQEETVWQNVEPGTYEITLSGVDAPCEIQGDVTQSVVVQADSADIVTFEVECVPRLDDHILFTKVESSSGSAARIRPDGSDLVELDPGLDSSVIVMFPTSVDGTTVTYLRRESGQPDQLWTMDADGAQGDLVTSHAGGISGFAVSLDGSHIVFSGGVTPRDLFVYDVTTGDLNNVTDTPDVDEAQPAWSPDGARIVYAREHDGSDYRIWTMDHDGANAAALTGLLGHETQPAWSPDGKQIAYASDRARRIDQLPVGDLEIHVVDADGTNDRFVSQNTIDDMLPAWSADSGHLVYMVVNSASDMAMVTRSLEPGAVEQTVVHVAGMLPVTTSSSWGR